MAMDELRGKDGNDDGLKKRRVTCCVCRSTKEHRCYKCFCGKCPSFTKKLPPRYGQKDRFSDSRPFDSSSVLRRNEETPVSDKVQMDTSAKQSVETSDLCTGDECPPGFSSALRSSSAVRNGMGDNGDDDRYSKAISPNSRIESGSSCRPSLVKEQRGDAEVGNQKLVTNEVDGGSSKSHAGSTSVWEVLAANEPKGDTEVGNQKLVTNEVGGGSSKSHAGSTSVWEVLAANEPKGNQEGWDKRDESLSSWGLEPLKERRGHSAGSDSNWGARKVGEPRGNDEVGNQKLMENEVDVGKSHDGSSSVWDVLAAKEPKASGNQEGWSNKAGSVSGWGLGPVNEQRGHSSGSDPSRSARILKEPRALGNQEGWGNKTRSVSGWGRGPVNERRGHSSRPYSNRSARGEEEPQGNRAERATSAGFSPRLSTRNVNESRCSTAGPFSHWGSQKVEKPRGNEEARANRAQDRSLKPVSSTPHDEFGSRWTSCSGKRTTRESEKQNKGSDVGNQKLVTNEVDGGSSKSHAGSTSIWDTLAAKEPKASGNQPGWDNKVGSDSSWGTWPINVSRGNAAKSVSTQDPRRVGEPRGNREVMAERFQDGSSKRDSRAPHAETGSRWNSYSGKRSRGDQQKMSNGTEDVSFGPVKKPRGNQEIMANTMKDGSSKQELLITNVESGSNTVPCTVKQSRGNQEATANKAKDKTFKQIPNRHEPVSNPRAQSGSSWSPSESRGKPEVANYRAGDGSSEQVLHNHHADPSLNYATAKEPRGNQKITGYKTENGSPLTVLHDPNAGIVSTPSSLTANEPTGHSVSGTDSVQEDQHDATVVSKIIIGVGGNKKIIDPAVASQRHAKPPPVVISGEKRSSLNDKFYKSQLNTLKDSSYPSSRETSGPVKEIIWKGHFEFLFPGESKVCESYLAHLAAKVSTKAYRFASQITGNLQFKMHPRPAFMPKIFTHDIPDASDIALYFYPERYERSRKEYAELFKLIEKQDLMLRSVMGPVELLVFTSKVLHEKDQKLEGGHYFLWGVFRQLRIDEVACSSKVVPTPHLGPTQVIQNST